MYNVHKIDLFLYSTGMQYLRCRKIKTYLNYICLKKHKVNKYCGACLLFVVVVFISCEGHKTNTNRIVILGQILFCPKTKLNGSDTPKGFISQHYFPLVPINRALNSRLGEMESCCLPSRFLPASGIG